MLFFKILWFFDALVVLVALYFFFAGLADGSVSAFNIGIWSLLLAGLAAALLGSWWLHAHSHSYAAKGILLILALPALCYVLFFLVMIIAQPRWN